MTARCLVIVTLLAVSAPAAAAEVLVPVLPKRLTGDLTEARAKAKKAYERASKALEGGNLELAELNADVAYSNLPNASTAALYCIALRERGKKQDAFRHCLIAASLKPSPAEKKLIDSIIAGVARSVGMGWAVVNVDPTDAQIKVGKQSFTGSRVVGLSPGDHTLEVSREGYESRKLTVSVSEGVQIPAVVALARKPTVVKPPEREKTWMTPVGWTMVGIGGAMVLGVVGIQGYYLENPPSTEDADTINNVSIGLGVGGGLLIAGGLTMALLDKGKPVEPQTGMRWHVAPAIHADGGGLLVGASF